ncbi:MAG: 23S rRNA (pseudouridine(1915)-N(3))-methyltransferase RlmH [Clostridia bacterium]|nr:23S rRNA (pseudouridine(1915)-N(3))-methyltransferase RlmH [Clostridia bacterium]
MSVNVLCVGRIKEKYLSDGIAEYAKRLSRFCKFNVIEVGEELSRKEGKAETEEVKRKEGERLAGKIKGYAVALAIDGEPLSSEGFARRLDTLASKGVSEITFIIGGSNGLSEQVLDAADMKLSFGAMTYPHQLMRLILAEQVYRAFMINGGGTYHK